MGGGLALGKEGPLVHTGACIASLLGQVSTYCPFEDLYNIIYILQPKATYFLIFFVLWRVLQLLESGSNCLHILVLALCFKITFITYDPLCQAEVLNNVF